jgi:uncharacterized damage-inducible protein DinB
MIEPAYAHTLAAYNRWMNQKIYALCAGIPDAERKRDRGAFFRSLHGTLNHLLLADRLWLGRFQARPFAIRSLDQELQADFEELRHERELTDEEIEAFAAGLTPERLAGELHYVSIVDPRPRRMRFAVAVAHFFHHQTHHRGQVTTLMQQCGVDPGVTDLMWLPGLVQA